MTSMTRGDSAAGPAARERRGVALAVALGAIVIIGALIAAAFYSSNNEYRATRNSFTEPRATAAAELGLNSVVSSWTPTRTSKIAVGAVDSLADTTLAYGTVVKRQWRKLSPTLFLVVATAQTSNSSPQLRSTRRLSALVHIEIPDFKIVGAVMSRGLTAISGNVQISGNDVSPTNWDCPPTGAPTAAIAGNNTATNVTTTGGCSGAACLTGTPQIKDTTALVGDTTNFSNFGAFNYDSLTKIADKTFTTATTFNQIKPSTIVSGGATICNTGDANNWGDTAHLAIGVLPYPCQDYMPIVWLQGATNTWNIQGGGGGQGILLIDGNVNFSGQFQWTGLVIVKGTISQSGNGGGGSTGVKIWGAIMAMNRSSTTEKWSGTGQVQFSRCAIATVTGHHATSAPLKYRAWADVF